MRLKFAMGAIGGRLAVALQAFAIASAHAVAIRHLAETRFCEHPFTLLQLPAAGRQRRRDGRGGIATPPRLAGLLQLGGRERIGATPQTACRAPPDVSGGNTAGNRSGRRSACANRAATRVAATIVSTPRTPRRPSARVSPPMHAPSLRRHPTRAAAVGRDRSARVRRGCRHGFRLPS